MAGSVPSQNIEFNGLQDDITGVQALGARTPILTDIAFILGLDTPTERTAAFTAIIAAGMYVTRPEQFFEQDGTPKQWSMMSDADEATPVPWWLASFGVGALLAQLM